MYKKVSWADQTLVQSWAQWDLVRKFLISERENFGVQQYSMYATTWLKATTIHHIHLHHNKPNTKSSYALRHSVVPQNFPSHLSRIFSQVLLGLKTALGFDHLKTPPYALMTKIRVWICTWIFELSMLHMTFMDHYVLQDHSCRVSSLGSHFWSVNWIIDLKISCIGEKIQPWPIYSKTS